MMSLQGVVRFQASGVWSVGLELLRLEALGLTTRAGVARRTPPSHDGCCMPVLEVLCSSAAACAQPEPPVRT
jgi:hypothetical protein